MIMTLGLWYNLPGLVHYTGMISYEGERESFPAIVMYLSAILVENLRNEMLI